MHSSWEGKGADGRSVPLGIYCRPSLAEYLDADAIFEVTRQGFDWFQEKFDYPYPFEKYDQLFVPEFNAGAMENAGAVTIRDQYVFRSKVTDAAYEGRAETILHELAHMWFGDLVTMEWWNDLWLNESFATYTSIACQAHAPGSRWPDAWTSFANQMKTWAYRQDQLPSTHPIMAPIRDLDDVLVNFDGITYAKGASVLKQLVAYVGMEEFFRGVRAYFQRHQWGNTRLSDLLGALEETSGRDLKTWSRAWLETAGINVLRPEPTCAPDGTLTALAIRQEAPALPAGAEGEPTLRPHRLGVGFYDLVDGKLVRTDSVELDVDGELTEVPLPRSRKRPDVLLLNDGDHTYAKVRLDEESLANVTRHLGDFSDPLPRALCWASAWDMARDAELSASAFLELVLSGIGKESDIGLVQSLQRQVKLALDLYAAPEHREAGLTRWAEAADEQLRAPPRRAATTSWPGRARSPPRPVPTRSSTCWPGCWTAAAPSRAWSSTRSCAGRSWSGWPPPAGPTRPRSRPSWRATPPRPGSGTPPPRARRVPPRRRRPRPGAPWWRATSCPTRFRRPSSPDSSRPTSAPCWSPGPSATSPPSRRCGSSAATRWPSRSPSVSIPRCRSPRRLWTPPTPGSPRHSRARRCADW